MVLIAAREFIVILLGVAIAFVASLFGDAGRDILALAAAILVPVAFCLVRAAQFPRPRIGVSPIRNVGSQLSAGLALAALLIFEIGVALFAGVNDAPLLMWANLSGFAMAYILLFTFGCVVGGRVGNPNA